MVQAAVPPLAANAVLSIQNSYMTSDIQLPLGRFPDGQAVDVEAACAEQARRVRQNARTVSHQGRYDVFAVHGEGSLRVDS